MGQSRQPCNYKESYWHLNKLNLPTKKKYLLKKIMHFSVMKRSLIYTNKVEKKTFLQTGQWQYATQKLPFKPERPSLLYCFTLSRKNVLSQ